MEVSSFLRRWGRRVDKNPKMWIQLGKFENFLLGQRIGNQQIEAPIFISGLPRSGSSLLLDILNSHSETTSFSEEDFPFLHVPWTWSKLRRNSAHSRHLTLKLERLPNPAAREEMLWMHFFPQIHKQGVSHLKGMGDSFPQFEAYYNATVKKLLWLQQSPRYLCKGNYHISRLGYLKRLFPSARFVIPIRHPVDQVSAVMKVHQELVDTEIQNPPVLDYLRSVGSFEFGVGRRAINTGDPKDSHAIKRLWAEERDVAAYATQWAVLYEHITEITKDPLLEDSISVLRYEDMFGEVEASLGSLFKHCKLDDADEIIQNYSRGLRGIENHPHCLSSEEVESIKAITGVCAEKFNYSFQGY